MGRAFEYRKASKLARWDKMAKTFSKMNKKILLENQGVLIIKKF